MRILLTGGAGFIGSSLAHHIVHRSGKSDSSCCPDHRFYSQEESRIPADVEVYVLDKLTYAGDLSRLRSIEHELAGFEEIDIADAEAVDGAFEGFEPDAVLHLAAESHVDRSIDGGQVFMRTNVLGTQVLLDAARRNDVEKFLHVSTDEVYGSIETGSTSEDASLDPSSPYAASKASSDLVARSHQETYGIPVAITRCTNNYGPRQHREKLIPKMVTRASKGDKLPIYGDGQNVRDWLYVKDHCQALLRILQDGSFEASIYNIAGRDERPNLEVVQRILDHLDRGEELIEFVEDRPGHDYRYSIDDERTRQLGWSPRVPFDEGLSHTIDQLLNEDPPEDIA